MRYSVVLLILFAFALAADVHQSVRDLGQNKDAEKGSIVVDLTYNTKD